MKLFDGTLTQLGNALDVRLYRQNVLSGNLANVDTPNFVPTDVDFDKAMASASRVEGGEKASFESAVQDVPGEGLGLDGNGVDLDQTMVSLAENGLQYGAVARTASKKLAILKYVANDGNG